MKVRAVKIAEILSDIYSNQNYFNVSYDSSTDMLTGSNFVTDIITLYSDWSFLYNDIDNSVDEFAFFKRLWNSYIIDNIDNFKHLYEALTAQYNAADTVDIRKAYNEDKTDELDHGKTVTVTPTEYMSTTTYNSTFTDQTTTDTSTTLRDDNAQVRSGYDTIEQSGTLETKDSGKDTRTIKRDNTKNYDTITGREGNVAQQLLDEIGLRQHDISDVIIQGFIRKYIFLEAY